MRALVTFYDGAKAIIEDTQGTENAVTWATIRVRFGGKDGHSGLMKRISGMNKQMHGLPPHEFEYRDPADVREIKQDEIEKIFGQIIDDIQSEFSSMRDFNWRRQHERRERRDKDEEEEKIVNDRRPAWKERVIHANDSGIIITHVCT